ncbi:MAG: hypothetical protein Q8M15_02205 [Bacteroidota bacterium]|nr:hypothetical protein [Bacteroidota bacterium]
MATPKTNITPEELEELSYKYIEDCINFKKEHPTASGKLVNISDRQIPTIDYFLKIWIPKQGKPTICRSTYYNWLNGEDQDKLDTIKNIEGVFKALAIDIVANEGKGIFYAKNRLGMTDKAQIEQTTFKPFEITGMQIL